MRYARLSAVILGGIMTCGGALSAGGPLFEMIDVFPLEGANIHRIPSIVVTRSGVVLAFADRRRGSRADWGHDTDVVLRRSLDGGRTWGPVQTLAARKGVCMHSGPALVDWRTGRVFKFHRHRPNPIKRPQDIARDFARWRREGYGNFILWSDDDGETWQGPREMGIASPEKHRVGNGGHGVQLPGGRLLVNGGSHKGVDDLKSFLFYSDDGGETWHGAAAGRRKGVVVEAATVVLADENVMVNHRTVGPYRRVTIYDASGGGGASGAGGARELRTYVDACLPEPFCHASIARYSLASETPAGEEGRNRLLFVNPPNNGTGRFAAGKRVNITMRLSNDDGRTWALSRSLYAGPSGYSDTAVLPDKTILCLFENGGKKYNDGIAVARVNLAWLSVGEGEEGEEDGGPGGSSEDR